MLAYDYRGSSTRASNFSKIPISGSPDHLTLVRTAQVVSQEKGTELVQANRRNEYVAATIFTITLSYAGKLHHTRVMRNEYRYGDPFYKVMLNSSMNCLTPICWLRRNDSAWSILMGQDSISAELLSAITLAIESHE